MEGSRSSPEDAVASARAEAAAAVAKAQVDVFVALSQWSDWISSRRDMFGDLMRTAPEYRRQQCRRLGEAADTPSPVRRLTPEVEQVRRLTPEARWVDILRGRTGWFALDTRRRPVTVLLAHLRRETWGLLVDSWARSPNTWRLGVGDMSLRGRVVRLADVASGVDVSAVYELCISVVAGDGYVDVSVDHATALTSPLPKPARAR